MIEMLAHGYKSAYEIGFTLLNNVYHSDLDQKLFAITDEFTGSSLQGRAIVVSGVTLAAVTLGYGFLRVIQKGYIPNPLSLFGRVSPSKQ